MTDIKDYVSMRKAQMKNDIATFERPPRLVVVQVGDNPASNSYIRSKHKACEEVGIEMHHERCNESITQKELKHLLIDIQHNMICDGLILQLPIPDHLNVEELQQCILPEKDVDGFRSDSFFYPCTPKGIIDWLLFNNIELEGKDVCVIGRSKIVGKPLVNMLIDEGATTTCCHSKTKRLAFYTKSADIIISAVGKPKIFGAAYFAENQIIVDVGINRDDNGKMCGDINKEQMEQYLENTYVTPVPGGVGPLTVCSLLESVITAYELQNNNM